MLLITVNLEQICQFGCKSAKLKVYISQIYCPLVAGSTPEVDYFFQPPGCGASPEGESDCLVAYRTQRGGCASGFAQTQSVWLPMWVCARIFGFFLDTNDESKCPGFSPKL